MLDPEALRVDEKKPDFKPEGIDFVYVNGRPVIENGTWVGGTAGEVVLKPRA